VAEAAGHRITLFEGSPYNMKVTDPLDIRIAELLLNTVS
ncbi:MAG: 2-C-methyl-D-erythritol 4-phosphate cytidylyltransferase, partial [Muribaculaceae bacterium]|nr:2-C-methyl-D-erythritol 4-phosphate cytidylyltransferase [Muribaculaceae bacterium]